MRGSAGHIHTNGTFKSHILDLDCRWNMWKLFLYWHPFLRFINHKLVNFEFVQMACVLKTLIMQWWMTAQLSSLLFFSSLRSCYMKMYTRRALFSSFIQNSSNEDKLLPGWATMAPSTLKRTKMAEWKWEGQRRSGFSISPHIHTRAHTHTHVYKLLLHIEVSWTHNGDSSHLSNHSSPVISSFKSLPLSHLLMWSSE